MNSYQIEIYFRKDGELKDIDEIPNLDNYKQETRMLKVLSNSDENMIKKVKEAYQNVSYISVLEVSSLEIEEKKDVVRK